MTEEKTGNGPSPVSFEDLAVLGLGQNRGGRPRKDGTRKDKRLTFKEAGFNKRAAARMRVLAHLPPEQFEAAIAKQSAEIERGGRRHALEYFLPDRRANSRIERETVSNIRRLLSTLRRIERDYEGDGSETGEAMRVLVQKTRELWDVFTGDDDD